MLQTLFFNRAMLIETKCLKKSKLPGHASHNRRKGPGDNLIRGDSLAGGRKWTDQRSRGRFTGRFEGTASDD